MSARPLPRTALPRRAGGALLAAAVLGLAPVGQPAASAAVRCSDGSAPKPTIIRTAPATPGLALTVSSAPGARATTVVTGPKGWVSAVTCMADVATTVPNVTRTSGKVRLVTETAVAEPLDVRVPVRQERLIAANVAGLPPGEVSRIVLRSNLGETVTFTPRQPVWLVARVPVHTLNEWSSFEVVWSVDAVMVGGSNSVNRGQQQFQPLVSPTPELQLRNYVVAFRVYDRVLGSATGSRVDLLAADGSVRRVPVRDGHGEVRELPRGSYTAVAVGPGLRVAQPLVISRDQTVALPMLTWLDLFILLGIPAMIGLMLVVSRRPHLRSVHRRLPWHLLRPTAATRSPAPRPTAEDEPESSAPSVMTARE